MKSTITMDRSGRIVLPKAVRRKLHLPAEAAFRVEVAGNRIELILVEDSPSPVKEKDGILVLPKTGKPTDAVEAIDEIRSHRS